MLSVVGVFLIIVGFYGNWFTRIYTLKKLEDTLEYLNKNSDENNHIKHNKIPPKTKVIMSLSPLAILVGIFLLLYN